MKKLAGVLLVLAFTMVLGKEASADVTSYSQVLGYQVNLNKTAGDWQIIRVKLDDNNWYQFESQTEQRIALYQAQILTALSLGREIRVYYHPNSANTLNLIDSIYMR